MVNATIRMLQDPDGSAVCNVAFDLSAAQLVAAAHAVEEIRVERHRGQELTTDDVLALRALTSIADELDGYATAGGHAEVTMPLARMVLLHDALDEWLRTRNDRGWLREADEEAHPVLAALVGPMAELRAEALREVFEAPTEAP